MSSAKNTKLILILLIKFFKRFKKHDILLKILSLNTTATVTAGKLFYLCNANSVIIAFYRVL